MGRGGPWSLGFPAAPGAHGSSPLLTAVPSPTVPRRLPRGAGQEGEGKGEQKEGGRGGGGGGGRGLLVPQEGQAEEQAGRWVSRGSARASSALPALTARSVPGGRTGAGSPGRTPKKSKVEPYSLTAQQRGLVREDQSNAKLWAELLKALTDGPVSVPRAPPPRPPAPKQRGRDADHRHRRDVSAQWHQVVSRCFSTVPTVRLQNFLGVPN